MFVVVASSQAACAPVAPPASPQSLPVAITSDGWRLGATWRVPGAGSAPAPAALLLHRAAGTRGEHDSLAEALRARGVASLALDLRGHGTSTNLGRFQPPYPEHLHINDSAHHDVSAALAWLAAQPGVDARRLAVVGASYSGEVAALAFRGGARRAAAYVMLSPGNFSAASIAAAAGGGARWLFVRTRGESPTSRPFIDTLFDDLARLAPGLERREIPGAGHATRMFAGRPELVAEIADWIGDALRAQDSAAYRDAWPQFSPDGRSIVFASTRDGGDWEIYVMAADGTAPRRLTRTPGRDAHPMFMPDGRRIVFQSPREQPQNTEVDLYIMNADGSAQRRLVTAPGFDGVPVPSRDGRRIAFQRSPNGLAAWHWELYVVNSDGGSERQLTDNRWSSQVPSWSHDGRTLVFHADPEGATQLYLLDVESGAVRPAGSGPGDADAPSFSPDGRHVAFLSTRDGGNDLYLLEVATGTVRRVTRGHVIGGQPGWSPDGTRVVVSAESSGQPRIAIVDLETGAVRILAAR